jgi:hypothetical protein
MISLVTRRRAARRAAPAVKDVAVQMTSEAVGSSAGSTSRGATSRRRHPCGLCSRTAERVAAGGPLAAGRMTTTLVLGVSDSPASEGTESGDP